jgi:hypothetical protein
MTRWVRLPVLLAVSGAGAAVWSYGMTVLQPLCEPGSPWWDNAQNNSYWARDVRWSAIAGVAVVLAVYGRASVAVAATLAWLAADVTLDRLDIGRPALLPAALIAGAVLGVLAVAATRWPAPVRPRVAGLLVMLCLVQGLSVATMDSPSDSEPQLRPAALAAFAVLALAALAATAALLTPRPPTRAHRWVAAGAAAVWLPLTATEVSPVAAALLTGVLGAAAVSATRPWPGPGRAVAVAAGYLLGLPALALVVLITLLDVARPFTALAGNPPINSADSDPSSVLITAAVVAAWAGLLLLGRRLSAELTPTVHPAGTVAPPAPGATV